jgi:hypothetical protein
MFGVVLILGLFVYDNSEFFNESKKQLDEGYHWEYVGKQKAEDYSFSLPVVNQETGEKFIYWKLEK